MLALQTRIHEIEDKIFAAFSQKVHISWLYKNVNKPDCLLHMMSAQLPTLWAGGCHTMKVRYSVSTVGGCHAMPGRCKRAGLEG